MAKNKTEKKHKPQMTEILTLKCGQMALGALEVRKVAKRYQKMSAKELKKAIKKRLVSIVIAPNGSSYIVDGHHHTAAAWMAGAGKVLTQVVRDHSGEHLSHKDFWQHLEKENCVHLYDQFGSGPHDPLYLPQDIRGLGDDPYRSLVWLVLKEGALEKPKERFADFEWANFFRKHRLLHGQFGRDFKSATKEACKLARSPKAKNLPGYVGTKNG
jgi:hypothetical protein